jgi:hypothetical protein
MDASPQQDHGQCDVQARPHPRVRCRRAEDGDAPAIAALLTRGFADRSHDYWTKALARLRDHRTPADCPKYGYVLEADGELVGVILLIFVALRTDEMPALRCNLSSWYVDKAYRSFASLLIAAAIRRKDATYLNVSPALNTRQTIEIQGFSCYARGQFYAVPIMGRPMRNVQIRVITADTPAADVETELLALHAKYGCLSVVCEWEGQSFPFVFVRRRYARTILTGAQLVYCRDSTDFQRFAAPLGWFLLKRGYTAVMIDANGALPGLAGVYFAGKAPKYYRGPQPPRLGDLAFTEIALFGP